MASVVKIKRSSVQGKAPTISDIQAGELALNTRDGKLFSSDGSVVFEVGANLHSLSVGTGGITASNGSYKLPIGAPNDGNFIKAYANGQLYFGDVDTSDTGGGFVRGTLIAFPTGDYGTGEDYVGATDSGQFDEFGVPLEAIYDCMDPNGRYITVFLGADEDYVGAA